MQKISVNAGFSCPNRDGTIGRGGCIYCVNTSFTPAYCFRDSEGRDAAVTPELLVSSQLEAGKQFFARKYPAMEYLAYFQSYTNTFGDPRLLERLYRTALETERVAGLIVGTRPDTVSEATLRLLGELNRSYPVFVELGAESSFDETLRLVNRGHTWETLCLTARRLADAGIRVGLHFIAGLPGEGAEEVLTTVSRAISLPVDSFKFHQLQVLEGSELARRVARKELEVCAFELDQYLDLCERIVEIVPKRICIERFLASAPPNTVIMPKWGIKNHEFVNMLLNRLKAKTGIIK